MKYCIYSHRFADQLLASKNKLKEEIDEVLTKLTIEELNESFIIDNQELLEIGKKAKVGMQFTLRKILTEYFSSLHWEAKKNLFNNGVEINLDFYKREVGVIFDFNNKYLIGNDLLSLQAASEIKNMINLGIYICSTKKLMKKLAPNETATMVNFERVTIDLANYYSIFTVPILVIGLDGGC